VFIANSHMPNTELFKGKITTDENGFVVPEQRIMTRIPVIFAAGDSANHVCHRAITAAGIGCASAIDAERVLAAENQRFCHNWRKKFIPPG
jgi:thioredoxin reductase (NADPH)